MKRTAIRAYLALAAICIIWGTTYTAIKFALRDFTPYLLVGIRQTAAGLLLLGWAWVTGRMNLLAELPSVERWHYLRRQCLTGLCTITGGNGLITWGMQEVSSGLAAVIGSLTPVVVVLINLVWRGSERVNSMMMGGVLLGFGGLGLVFHQGWTDLLNPTYRWGIAACLGSCVTWSLGTVMAKRWNDERFAPALHAGLQVTAGGLGGFVLSVFFDPRYPLVHTGEGWLSMAYLTIVGSALAFSLYMFTLQHLSAAVSSLYTYINPIVAIALGWVFLEERLGLLEALGMLIAVAGVWLVNYGHRLAIEAKNT
ncbi:MAG: EamA family transporter [Saprospiraceae bacterium]|nr:EamA family transporter [Saprospiraceae bacterium]MDW8483470.1 EamA family transporter [Saprospiraceae bacterium]